MWVALFPSVEVPEEEGILSPDRPADFRLVYNHMNRVFTMDLSHT